MLAPSELFAQGSTGAKPAAQKPPAPAAPRPARPSVNAARPSASPPLNVEGVWTGSTAGGQSVSLTIRSDAVMVIDLGYSIPGKGCFMVPVLNGRARVYWDEPSEYTPRVKGRRLSFDRSFSDRSPGINADIIAVIEGAFQSAETFSGAVQYVAVSQRRCEARTSEKLTLRRTAAAAPSSDASVAGAPPAGQGGRAAAETLDGEWTSASDAAQVLRFTVLNRIATDLALRINLNLKGCLPALEISGTIPLTPVVRAPGVLMAQGTVPTSGGAPPDLEYEVAGGFSADGSGVARVRIGVVEERRRSILDPELAARCRSLFDGSLSLRRVTP